MKRILLVAAVLAGLLAAHALAAGEAELHRCHGRKADIVGKVGLYDDPAVQAYVSELGMKLAAGSERPKLPWSFKVLDDSEGTN